MYPLAIQILSGDRAKFTALILGLSLASLLITQQLAIFCGLMWRTFAFLDDTPSARIWIMDADAEFPDAGISLPSTAVNVVRGIEGVSWAMPLFKRTLPLRLPNGKSESASVVGIDASTLIGGPMTMLEGRIEDLRRPDAVIIDEYGANVLLALEGPEGALVPLRVGDVLEINDQRAEIVGICRLSRNFEDFPILYTTYERALRYAPPERRLLSFVIAGLQSGADLALLKERIAAQTGLKALTIDEFKVSTFWYIAEETGIPINFGITVTLGFLVGISIAAQTFYTFTRDNLRQFAALKAMGARPGLLIGVVLSQALTVGVIGLGLGAGAASFIGYLTGEGDPPFLLLPPVLAATSLAILLTIGFAALLSIIPVLRLDPATVFRT
ncbi:MAG: ABC transporter permease [Candidatus Sumerlaeia bacterium]|nr:ABC transporter permease [Candidatus Sumerlaeia bacterium]